MEGCTIIPRPPVMEPHNQMLFIVIPRTSLFGRRYSKPLLLNKVIVGDCSRRQPEGSLFNSYYTDVEGTTPFPGLLHFTLDMYLILLSVKQRNNDSIISKIVK